MQENLSPSHSRRNRSPRRLPLPLIALFSIACGLLSAEAAAEQPIFDEMPRWNDGWGVQVLEEYRTESELQSDGDVVGSGFTEEAHILHIEGVYTWTKAFRMTLKLPVILHAERTLPGDAGETITQTDRGVGDPTLTIPLKSYFNLDGRSGSWTLAPHLRVPTAGHDDYDIADHLWGGGLSAGYSTETFRYHIGLGASAWAYSEDEPFDFTLNAEVGLNVQVFGVSGHIKWKTTGRYETDGTTTVTAGPTVYVRITDTWHGQLIGRHDFYDKRGNLDHASGDAARVGLGVVF